MRVTALAIAAVLLTAGCSSHTSVSASPSARPSSIASTASQQHTLAWGQPAFVLGSNGNELKITPLGVLYTKGPYKGLTATDPQNGWYAVIALQAVAVSSPDTIPAPVSGGGFYWYGKQQEISLMQGNAANAPWTNVPSFSSNLPIQPGQPQEGIETFDVPVKAGALLQYVNPGDTSQRVSWPLPATDQGSGLESVTKYLATIS